MRAGAQRLTKASGRAASPARVLEQVCGLQAQVLDAAVLGLRARTTGLRQEEVDQSLTGQRSIVRTWLMRGTLHLVSAQDLRWMLGILGPVFAAGNQRRHAQLGLDEDLKTRGVKAIARILANGPQTRYEIVDRLRRHGIDLDRKTQAPIHLISYAALRGICCLGPQRPSGEPTYVLLDDWVPASRMTGSASDLARRYFSAFGPATIDDFAAWSGLPMSRARPAATDAVATLAQMRFRAQTMFLPKGRLSAMPGGSAQNVRLLPAFDTYLLGYRRRDLAVPEPLQRRLQRGGGWIHPAVIVDGRALAAWSLDRSRGTIGMELLAQPESAIRRGIDSEVDDISRFLGSDLSMERLGTGGAPAPHR